MKILLTNSLHPLKLADQFVDPVKQGIKTFEIRFDDRNYHVGDRVTFRGIHSVYVITYVLKNIPQYGLLNGFCLFSMRKLTTEDIQRGWIEV